MKISVITVTYNSGDKLLKTVENCINQSYSDVEIIVKDGLSTDGSYKRLCDKYKDADISPKQIKLVEGKDKGIYDAMNTAVSHATGALVIFMNCGDYFYDEDVLTNAVKVIKINPKRGIYYGNAYFRNINQIMHMPSIITESICYRHIPCHQSCIFERRLFQEDGFNTDYKIRADYDFFLRNYFVHGIKPCFLDITVSDYEGGGYSENKENIKRDKLEHQTIVTEYMGRKKVRKYKMLMALTLQPVRKFIVTKTPLKSIYDKIKKSVYN